MRYVIIWWLNRANCQRTCKKPKAACLSDSTRMCYIARSLTGTILYAFAAIGMQQLPMCLCKLGVCVICQQRNCYDRIGLPCPPRHKYYHGYFKNVF